MPKTLHKKMAESAETEGVSLNQYLVSFLSHSQGLASVNQAVNEFKVVKKEESPVNYRMSVVEINKVIDFTLTDSLNWNLKATPQYYPTLSNEDTLASVSDLLSNSALWSNRA